MSIPSTAPSTGSIIDYSALPGPGAQPSKMPALDAKMWTLKVALGQRPWSFIASIGMAISFICNGLTPVVVGRAVDEAIANSDLMKLGWWIAILAGLFVLAIAVNWIARYMMVRSQQLLSHDLRTMVTDRIQDPRGLAGRERTAVRLHAAVGRVHVRERRGSAQLDRRGAGDGGRRAPGAAGQGSRPERTRSRVLPRPLRLPPGAGCVCPRPQ